MTAHSSIQPAPVIDPRARDVVAAAKNGQDFVLTLSCDHVVRRRVGFGEAPRRAICSECPAVGGIHTAKPSTAPARPRPVSLRRRRRRGGGWFDWSEENVARLKELWAREDLTADEIAVEMGARSRNVILGKVHKLDLPKRKTGRRADPDRRSPRQDGHHRRFVASISRKNRHLALSPQHWAVKEGRSRYRNRVTDSSAAKHVLVSGENSRKIGRRVEKGPWKGMPIVTLTLEERKTCPSTCPQWRNCYGNNMNWALRIQEDGDFAIHLSSELLRLNARFPAGFVVRLHVLGDFFSVEYVDFWRLALESMPALRVWGYTAREIDTPIGAALWDLARDNWDRFALRWSNRGVLTAASEVVDDEADAGGIICPAELDENRSCGRCGLCWASKKGTAKVPAVPLITFLRH